MNKKRRVSIRYSEAFKHQVVKDIEDHSISLDEARKKYGIKGGSTVYHWIKKMGKLDLLPKRLRVEKPDETDRIKVLERQVAELKNALADTQLRFLVSETQFEIVCEEQGLDPEEVKKKVRQKPSKD